MGVIMRKSDNRKSCRSISDDRRFYNTYEFDRLVNLCKSSPVAAKAGFEDYLLKYPNDLNAQIQYTSILITLGYFDKAEQLLDNAEYKLSKGRIYKTDPVKESAATAEPESTAPSGAGETTLLITPEPAIPEAPTAPVAEPAAPVAPVVPAAPVAEPVAPAAPVVPAAPAAPVAPAPQAAPYMAPVAPAPQAVHYAPAPYTTPAVPAAPAPYMAPAAPVDTTGAGETTVLLNTDPVVPYAPAPYAAPAAPAPYTAPAAPVAPEPYMVQPFPAVTEAFTVCRGCGYESPDSDGLVFCPKCGTPLR